MASMMKLIDENGNAITAQQAYDAAMSGPVYALMDNNAEGNHSIEIFVTLNLCCIIRENENVISMVFSGSHAEGPIYYFYAGENPNNIEGDS